MRFDHLEGIKSAVLAPTGMPAWFMMKDKGAFKSHLEKFAETPELAPMTEKPGEILRTVASRL